MLNECVISRVKTKNKNVLIKNRDRNYIPKILIVRDYIKEKDLEICYYIDLRTGWVEGINSEGIALINSSLLVEYDEKEISLQSKNNKISNEGKIILNALKQNKIKDTINSLITPNRLNGHTFISYKENSYNIECMPNSKIFIEKINDIDVRTNHGFKYSKTGYVKGDAKISTTSRLIISKKELELNKQNNYKSLLNSLSKDYINWDSKFQPNRNKKIDEKTIITTMQILFDTMNNIMVLNINEKFCELYKVIDKRPKDIKRIKLKVIKELK